MFETLTERARRAVFFAHHEANRFGSASIDTEHLLLGLLREDRGFASELPSGALAEIQRRIEDLYLPSVPRTPPIDLPLTEDSKRVLAIAQEESEELGHSVIDTRHLALGLLCMEGSAASAFLHQYGFEYGPYRETVRQLSFTREPRVRTLRHYPIERAAPSLQAPIRALEDLMDTVIERVQSYSEADADQTHQRSAWTPKDALGHLIDWAAAHQQWLARALTEPKLVVSAYPSEDWALAQWYCDLSWREIVELWGSLNRLLIHVLLRIPEAKLNVPCRIGVADPIPLTELMARYVKHCEDVAGQMLARQRS
jgi:hypothetical protein